MRGALKRRKSDGVFYSSNVTWDATKRVAKSYGWWEFVKPIGGKLVFNTYGYSMSTRRHQRKVENHISNTFTKVDEYIEAPNGLQDLESAGDHYVERILELESAMMKKGSHLKTNLVRAERIRYLRGKIEVVQSLIKGDAMKL